MGYHKLNNNLYLPDICYGTGMISTIRGGKKWFLKKVISDSKQVRADLSVGHLIDTAYKNGCIMFDTSRAYGGSEYVLGRSLGKYRRDSYMVSTKLANIDQYNRNVLGAINYSLNELQTDYIDLYLMHWPVSGHFVDSWKVMEEQYAKGVVKSIGVCNFDISHLEELKGKCEIMPMVNQIECHPLFTQEELREYCKANNICVMAYTPTARMDERLINSDIEEIATKYNKSIAQIVIKWHIQNGNIPVFGSKRSAHVIMNMSIGDFELTKEEIDWIASMNINSRLRYDPSNCNFRRL